MKRKLISIWILGLFFVSVATQHGQGTVSFANVGFDNSPASWPGGELLGSDYEAQLQFTDGRDIGDPIAFLDRGGLKGNPSGYFAGGVRTIPGISNSVVDLQIAVHRRGGGGHDCGVPGHLLLSNPISVQVSDGSIPPVRLAGVEFDEPRMDQVRESIEDAVFSGLAQRMVGEVENVDLRLTAQGQSGLKQIVNASPDVDSGLIQSLAGIQQFEALCRLVLTGVSDEADGFRQQLADDVDLSPIAALRQLRCLDLSGNRLRLNQDDLDLLLALPELETLDLSGATFEGTVDLSNVGPNLTHLRLNQAGLRHIQATQSKSLSLELLELNGNHLTKVDLELVAPELKRIELRENPLSEIRVSDFSVVRLDGGIVFPESLRIEGGKPFFRAFSSDEVIIQRSSDLNRWEEVGRQLFRRLNPFIGTDEFLDESYSGGAGPVFYRLIPID